jgi:hypothetical protein
MASADRAGLVDRALKQAAGNLARRGTVVGMATSIDLHSYRIVSASYRDVFVSVLALLPRQRTNRPTPHFDRRSRPFDFGKSLGLCKQTIDSRGDAETMAIGVEVRTNALRHAGHTGELSMPPASAAGLNCVAVSTYEDPGQRYRGDYGPLRELMTNQWLLWKSTEVAVKLQRSCEPFGLKSFCLA